MTSTAWSTRLTSAPAHRMVFPSMQPVVALMLTSTASWMPTTSAMDRCPGTGAGIVVDTEGCAIQQTFALEGVKFEFNSAKLTANAKIVLQDVIDTLSGQPSMQAQVAGHTDSKGLAAYNERLSEERAMSVKQFLVDNGIAADRLTVVGYGESKPIATNDTEEGREANRRVEFSVISE